MHAGIKIASYVCVQRCDEVEDCFSFCQEKGYSGGECKSKLGNYCCCIWFLGGSIFLNFIVCAIIKSDPISYINSQCWSPA